MNSYRRPRRILHVLDSMERGGIATWLMTVLRHIERDTFHLDFLVHTDEPCAYDEEARSLGARVIPCPEYRNIVTYCRTFSRILKEYGPYDVLHGHCHRFSGVNLWLAKRARIPVRIAHSHSDLRSVANEWGISRRAYLAFMDKALERYATLGLAAGRLAAEDLFGPKWETHPKRRILFCGIDFSPFHETHERHTIRAEMGLNPTDKIVAHVGRFTQPKNCPFVLEVFSHALNRDSNLRLVFIGNGPLQGEIQEKVSALGLQGHVRFLGSRPDVPRILSAVDLFLFPSLYEGMGLAVIEAQASGLPCLISENIPHEADIVLELITRLPLSLTADRWAENVISLLHADRPVTADEALRTAEESQFNIRHSLGELELIYLGTDRNLG
ncbi:glycosyltransferase family 1 protein [Desulfomonile tiedjei]|uniref:Glycosyltransferase n=1 Tax=Desulfomonile tiedjei (strain ATCC 49306 / DSM 6799 / DCB-1) TaxID=706587 RepID=I4C7F1_DESTA|nr:glycosyltransferase family 1 protein [Desulfomonile tiedjei]AFM25492.1 glycosyltransferase [Desulfomonile tiedjei DSM 6799]